jgi:alpha-1,2-mannosyltransferase
MNVYGLRLLREAPVQRAIAALVVVLLLAYRGYQLVRDRATLPWGYDFSAYWTAGRHLLDGRPIYDAAQLAGSYPGQGEFLFLNPPALAALVTPLSAAFPTDFYPAYAIWVGLGLAVFAGATFWLARRVTRTGLLPAALSPVVLTGAMLALPAVSGELVNGNVDFFLAGLLVVAWWGIARADVAGERWAGIALGVATLVKVFPALVVLWLLVRGRYRAVGWAIAAAAALALASLPLTGIEPWLQYPAVLLNMGGALDTTFALAPSTWLTPLLGAIPARLIVDLACVAVVAWVARRAPVGVGFATSIVASLLITPLLWSHYLTIAVVPFLVALGSGLSVALLAIVYVLLSVQNPGALGDLGFIIARALPTLGILLLLGILLVVRPNERAIEPG